MSLAVAADIGLAGKLTYPGQQRVTYELIVIGLSARARPIGLPLEVELEPGVALVHQDRFRVNLVETPGRNQLMLRLAAGFHLRF